MEALQGHARFVPETHFGHIHISLPKPNKYYQNAPNGMHHIKRRNSKPLVDFCICVDANGMGGHIREFIRAFNITSVLIINKICYSSF